MAKSGVFLFSCLLSASSLVASTPPPLPPVLLPQQEPPPARPAPVLVGKPVHLTPALVKSLGFSDAVRSHLLNLMASVPSSTPFTTGTTAASDNDSRTWDRSFHVGPTRSQPNQDAAPQALGSKRLSAAPNTTPSGAAAVTVDTNSDIEPAIITNRFTENGVTVDRTTTVFTKFDASGLPQHYWGSTTNGTTFPLQGILQPQGNATRTNDPMLAENPYISAGDFPKRTYAVGASYDATAGITGYSEIRVWYKDAPFPSSTWQTDDQGTNQNLPVASVNNPFFFDKPSIWVSWAQGSLGYVYVAATLINFSTGSHTIYVYRGRKDPMSGRLAFTLANTSFTGGATEILSPIVTVDSSTGYVYLLWLSGTGRPTINVARSTDLGATFTRQPSLSIGTPFTESPNQETTLCDTNNECHRAASAIMARPRVGINASDKDIGVVWHQYETGWPVGTNRADVYFGAFSMDSLLWLTSTPVHVGHQPANDGYDQWDPALDPGSDGTYMLTWYDKRVSSTNEFYQVYATKMYPWGVHADSTDTLVYNSAAAADILPIPADSHGVRLIGEYQDLWEWFGTFHGASIYTTTTEDAYTTTILP